MSWVWFERLGLVVALVSLLVPASHAAVDSDLLQSERGIVAMCETAHLEIGSGWARWALNAGFYSDEREEAGRDFVWMRRAGTLTVALSERADRTLHVRARSASARSRVRLRFNGFDLGQVDSSEDWTDLRWTLPTSVVRVGLNRIELEADQEVDEGKRQLGLCLDYLTVESDGRQVDDCRTESGFVEVSRTSGPVTLRAGQIVAVPVDVSPRSRLIVQFGCESHGNLEVLVATSTGQQHVSTIVSPSNGGAGTVAIELLDGLTQGDEIALVARGNLTLTEVILSEPADPLTWRHACRSDVTMLATAMALLAVIVVARRPQVRLPGSRWAPWLDAAVVAVTAFAVREVFLSVYPYVDPRRFGDSWEYLFRANKLVEGASFWWDTSWHAWQTWIRPPGFYLLLAAVKGSHAGLHQLAQVQVVLAALTAAATYLMAYPLFGRTAAVTAGLLFAAYAEATMSVTWVLTEVLYMALVVPALAALAWMSVRPTTRRAIAAGVLFGMATLVRSTPLYYVPLAAGLVVVAHGRRGVRPAVVMTAVMLLTVLPWCVRNSLIYGMPMGVDDIAISNFLQAHPDDELVQVRDVDVTTPDGFRVYYDRLKAANHGAALTRHSGILRSGLVRLARHPGATLRTFWRNLDGYFGPFPESYPREYQGENRMCAVVGLTDALNVTYVIVLAFGVGGAILKIRDRQSWPILLWFVFGATMVNLLFYPDFMPGRFRLPTMPVMMVYAGVVVQRLVTDSHAACAAVDN